METVLGERYRLIDVIGQGGTSVVWRAHDELLERDVAVKVLREGGDERFRTSIRAEAKAAARLTNSRIAHIYDYGETAAADGPVPYLVMELVIGEPLSQHLDSGTALPWWHAATIGAQISDALLAAHTLGLVHRDIKPGNVILTADGVKLIDFGISALVGAPDMDENGRLVGTAAYVAPERLADAPVGVEADVYSLGVLLYRMLAGTIPWDTDTRTQLLAAHLFVAPHPLPLIPGMPARLATLCAACINKEPRHRPTMNELARDLRDIAAAHATSGIPLIAPVSAATEAFLVDRPDGAHAAGIGATATFSGTAVWDAPSVRRRSRKRVAVIAGVGACLVVLSVAAWTRNNGSDPITAATPPSTCTAAFSVTRDSGVGFAAKLAVTNVATAAVNNWTVSFAFPGDQRVATRTVNVAVAPNDHKKHPATLRQSGATVTAWGSGAALKSGQSLTIPLTGTYRDANPIPTVVTLNGNGCRTSVNGAATPPTSAPRPGKPTAPPTTGTGVTPSTAGTPSDGSSQTPGPGDPTPTPTVAPVPIPTPTVTPTDDDGSGDGNGGGGGGGNGGGPGPG